MRLDRFLSQVSALSRSQARSAIRAGRVVVEGDTINQPSHQVDSQVAVALDGALLRLPQPQYYMLNKPQGVVCATQDPSHRTVVDLLDTLSSANLHMAGRLDIDTTGLVLLTDDGQWSHRITAPNRDCGKTYRVTLASPLAEADAAQIRLGVALLHEEKPTRPAELKKIDEFQFLLTITEGKYHQVKRMFAAVGNRVVALHRESIGALVLDSELSIGEYRHLSAEEVALF
ncbi:MAG: 16S rRNA pseudouridine(516) synthase RsuA [Candidatus Thiodiazotropha sp.]|jgi:16S rRNA pseudouridine516 synthase